MSTAEVLRKVLNDSGGNYSDESEEKISEEEHAKGDVVMEESQSENISPEENSCDNSATILVDILF